MRESLCAKFEPLNLAGCCLWQFVDEINDVRVAITLQSRFAPLLEFGNKLACWIIFRSEDDNCSYTRHSLNRDTNRCGFRDCRMFHQHILDLYW